MVRRRITLGLVALLLTTCGEFVGVESPLDEIYFPTGLALHSSGRYLYVVSSNFDVDFSLARGGTVAVVDTDTLEIVPGSTVRIGSFAGKAALTSDERHLYVAVRGDNSVVRLDVSENGRQLSCEGGDDGLPCRVRDLVGDPFGVVVQQFVRDLPVGGETLIDLVSVTHLGNNDLTAITIKNEDLQTAVREVAEVTTAGTSVAAHPRTGNLYVTARFDDRIRIVHPVIGVEGNVVAINSRGNVPLPNPTGNYDTRDIVFSSDGDRAYVVARNPHGVLVLDTSPSRASGGGSRDEWIATVDLDRPPEAAALVEEADGPILYVTEFGADSITIVDPVNAVPIGRFPAGDGPSYPVVDGVRHRRMYVSLFNENAVGVIDLDPDSRRFRTLVAKVR